MKIVITLALAAALVALSVQAEPTNLLTGFVPNIGTDNEFGNETKDLRFALTGENRQDIIGGEIKLGELTFTIDKVSQRGLIGASRTAPNSDGTPGRYAEFAVFSSSFSQQTATGQPWVAAKVYVNCDQAYNSFLAIYHLDDGSAISGSDKSPYPALLEDVGRSDDSIVYCFNSKPPA